MLTKFERQLLDKKHIIRFAGRPGKTGFALLSTDGAGNKTRGDKVFLDHGTLQRLGSQHGRGSDAFVDAIINAAFPDGLEPAKSELPAPPTTTPEEALEQEATAAIEPAIQPIASESGVLPPPK